VSDADEDTRSAASLYHHFREERPKRARRVAVNLPRAVAVLGYVEFLGYVTTHRGRSFLYLHEFAPGSRPMMAAGKKRNQLLLVGGRYHVTSRGIVDLDAHGREVGPHRLRYKVTLRRKG
jgi:hypothetical protein